MPKVLALTANPLDQSFLRLDAEIRDMRHRLNDAPNFRLEHRGATRAADLLRLLQLEKPDILHFAGHGGPSNEYGGAIELEDEHGLSLPVRPETVKSIFRHLRHKPRLVVLNCCYAEPQARAFASQIDVVIGAKGALADELAIQFAEGLFEYLAKGEAVVTAFELAKTQVILTGGDPRQFRLLTRRQALAQFSFKGRPEIMAEFLLDKGGRPKANADGEYSIHLWVDGAADFADSVAYQICDESFDEQFWEVTRAADGAFKTYDFRSYGQVSLRATAWSSRGGVGVTGTLTEALTRRYGAGVTPVIRAAIEDLLKY